MTERELVSVLLPCRDAAPFAATALESLLTQSHTNLEVVAVDDGSTDGTRSILEGYARRDPRVKVIRPGRAVGLIRALNWALDESRGAFVARMDADDVAEPDRILRQIALLKSGTGISVVGTGARLIDETGATLGYRRVRSRGPAGSRFLSLLATPVIHPSLLADGDTFRRYRYREAEECLHAEDYDLFARMVREGVGVGNVDEPLMRLRIRPKSVSQRFEPMQVANFIALAKEHLRRTLGVELENSTHTVLVNRMKRGTTCADLWSGLCALTRVREAFLARERPGPSDRREIEGVVSQQRLDIILQGIRRGDHVLRLGALVLGLLYSRDLLSAPARQYLGAKLRQFAGRGLSRPRAW